MLTITNVTAQVADKTILDNVSIEMELGKFYCLLGKNGSGKSSLAKVIMGDPTYKILNGTIQLDGEDISSLPVYQRAQKGIFVSFQQVPEIKGLKLFEFLRTSYNAVKQESVTFLKFKKIIVPLIEELGMDKEFLWRDLNVGCSGGEKRKLELLQMKLLTPRYVLLDEIDSGLDVSAVREVTSLLQDIRTAQYQPTMVLISHNLGLIESLPIEEFRLMKKGKIVEKGGKEVIKNY